MQKTLAIGDPSSGWDPSGYFALTWEPDEYGGGPLEAWLELRVPSTHNPAEIKRIRDVVRRLDAALRAIERGRRRR